MKEYLTYKEVSELINIKHNTLYAMVARDQIPFVRFSTRVIRFNRKQIQSWIKSKQNLSHEIRKLSV